MKTLSLKVPEKLEKKLARLAQSRGVTKSEVMRQLLERADEADTGPRRSPRHLAPDICGSVAGPGHLLSNPKHMDGFGA